MAAIIAGRAWHVPAAACPGNVDLVYRHLGGGSLASGNAGARQRARRAPAAQHLHAQLGPATAAACDRQRQTAQVRWTVCSLSIVKPTGAALTPPPVYSSPTCCSTMPQHRTAASPAASRSRPALHGPPGRPGWCCADSQTEPAFLEPLPEPWESPSRELGAAAGQADPLAMQATPEALPLPGGEALATCGQGGGAVEGEPEQALEVAMEQEALVLLAVEPSPAELGADGIDGDGSGAAELPECEHQVSVPEQALKMAAEQGALALLAAEGRPADGGAAGSSGAGSGTTVSFQQLLQLASSCSSDKREAAEHAAAVEMHEKEAVEIPATMDSTAAELQPTGSGISKAEGGHGDATAIEAEAEAPPAAVESPGAELQQAGGISGEAEEDSAAAAIEAEVEAAPGAVDSLSAELQQAGSDSSGGTGEAEEDGIAAATGQADAPPALAARPEVAESTSGEQAQQGEVSAVASGEVGTDGGKHQAHTELR